MQAYKEGQNCPPVGQQRIAVVPISQIYPAIEARPEWTDSLVWGPDSVTRVRHDGGKRYRQGV